MNNQSDEPRPPVPPTPPFTPAQPASPVAAPPSVATHSNSQVFGILGVVFPFVGLALVGLIFSIIATVQSAKAHTSKALGIIGIVLNAIGIVLGILWIVFLIFLSSYAGVQERAKTSSAHTDAVTIMKKAEAYYAMNEKYPQAIADFEANSTSSLESITSTGVTVTTTPPASATTIQYEACGLTGAKIAYYDVSTDSVVPSYLGDGSSTSCKS